MNILFMPLLKLVSRYLFSGKPTTKFATYTALFGTFLATVSTLVTVGIMNGFEESVKKHLLTNTFHITAYVSSRREAEEFLNEVKKYPFVQKGYWYATFPVILQKGKHIVGTVIFGTDKGFVENILNRKGVLFSGKLTPNGLILGNLLASQVGVYETPSKVTVISPVARVTPIGFLPQIKRVEVGGIYSSGDYYLDSWGVGYFNFLISFLKPSNFVVGIKLKDPYSAKKVGKFLEDHFKGVFITTWIDTYRDFFNALKLEKLGMILVVSLIVLVASFNIVSLLIAKVRELSVDFAIFRAFGVGRKFIFSLVLLLGVSVGLAGSLLGVAVAEVIAYVVNHYKLIRVPQELYTTPYLPIIFSIKEIILTVLFILFLSLLASLIPAFSAVRERVTSVLRND
ncbi:MAG TPA: ABC transporter permease [Aquifex aeolicus]|nr:ABC transporter permease [Aquificales bacterium]HIQ26565.1 ABC transporter permease [Aquifex aeolicus]